MKDPQPTPILRRDYRPPSHLIDRTSLRFELGEDETLVHAVLEVRQNPEAAELPRPDRLELAGEGLELRRIAIDGRPAGEGEYTLEAGLLVLEGLPASSRVETTVAIRPQDNTALEGLYKSSGNFCTQCEAEGFRRITYYLDRPDVMSKFDVTIVGDAQRYPVMLSNGNRVAQDELDDGRTAVRWIDPFPKPSYLFALVAGRLQAHRGTFTTRSGREVALEIWVEAQNIDKCEHALLSLQKAMKWDEEVFGLEYDLDVYMIVAVNDFNMGAMENKGLNVFNSKYVLAKPETATDEDYEGIEGVIAHEYFHNWTGNRVTCRDWFQLTLKEGLTVFRDQQFTADVTSAAVKRIDDVKVLRTAQFPEDQGPMAHPIRPESYIEMNNFYTVTVYNKGAEIIRMMHTLLGADAFRRGMDLYFERHDGQAVTCDHFRAAMADASGIDLGQFERWYSQLGTPRLEYEGSWDATARTYTLTLRQLSPVNVDPDAYLVRHMPVAVGLLAPDGTPMQLRIAGDDEGPTTRVISLREAEVSHVFEDVCVEPVPSVLRGFSAPVEVVTTPPEDTLAFLMANDEDPFCRWDAGQTFARRTLLRMAAAVASGEAIELESAFIRSWGAVLSDDALDPSLKALALELPEERVLGQSMAVVDVDCLRTARKAAMTTLGQIHREALLAAHQANVGRTYDASAEAIARRRLANVALSYLVAGDPDVGSRLAFAQFEAADNMTDRQAALMCLVEVPGESRRLAVEAFFAAWKHDPLVVDKWFAVQAQSGADDALDVVLELAAHPEFKRDNPNRLRSLVGVFGMRNQAHFHAADGRGYRFVADEVLAVDALNPQTAARIVAAFNQWRRFDPGRRASMKAQLERIVAHDGLSRDVHEIAARALAENRDDS